MGIDGRLANIRTRAVKGRLTAQAALDRLLRDTPLEAIAVGPASFRLRPRRPSVAAAHAPVPPLPQPEGEITVTANRRAQPLFEAPVSIAVASGDLPDAGPAPGNGTRAVAARIDGLALTNLGPGRNRLFLRGIADSPFNGYSQSTVSIVLDDSRITFDAPDPDLRLVDIGRVEVLKGPQGPLYGTGALGGVYRLVTNKPDPDARTATIETNGTLSDDLGGGVDAVLNLPVATGRLGLRASGYVESTPGWIANADGRLDSNREHVSGGRAALRWLPAPGWTADMAATIQLLTIDDSQYLPSGAPAYHRPNTISEPHDNDIRILSGAVSGPLGGLRLALSSSITRHEVRSTLDASASASQLGVPAPAIFVDDRTYTVEDQEFRLSSPGVSAIGWVAGLSRLATRTDIAGDLTGAGTPANRIVSLARNVTELAAYGSVSLRLAPRWSGDIGIRLSSTSTEDEQHEPAGTTTRASQRQVRIAPSAALSWTPSSDTVLFVRYAEGARASGIAANIHGAAQPFRADRLGSIELGARVRVHDVLEASASLYRTRWRDMQSDYLLPNGLISTRNAGNANILGIEANLRWHPAPVWSFEAGIVAQRARLADVAAGATATDDPRLPIAPDLSVRAGMGHGLHIGSWQGEAAVRGRYVSPSRLSFDAGLDRHQPGFATFTASTWLGRGPWRVTLTADNILDAHPDTFAFGNPFSIREQPQATPLAPRTVSLGVRYLMK